MCRSGSERVNLIDILMEIWTGTRSRTANGSCGVECGWDAAIHSFFISHCLLSLFLVLSFFSPSSYPLPRGEYLSCCNRKSNAFYSLFATLAPLGCRVALAPLADLLLVLSSGSFLRGALPIDLYDKRLEPKVQVRSTLISNLQGTQEDVVISSRYSLVRFDSRQRRPIHAVRVLIQVSPLDRKCKLNFVCLSSPHWRLFLLWSLLKATYRSVFSIVRRLQRLWRDVRARECSHFPSFKN